MPRRALAELNCHVEPEEDEPRLAVVLCHGYGAPANDLIPIGAELHRVDPGIRKSVRFYFPAAPIDLAPFGMPGGRAWWPINMEQLVRATESGRWEDVRKAMPAGLSNASDQLLASLDAIREETGLPWSRVVIGGFSQGAILATDVTLRLPEASAGLIIASGTLLSEQNWSERAESLPNVTVIQGHGHEDPLLPFTGAEALRDLLSEASHSVEFLPFKGGHTIDTSLMIALAGRLAELAAKSE